MVLETTLSVARRKRPGATREPTFPFLFLSLAAFYLPLQLSCPLFLLAYPKIETDTPLCTATTD